MTSAGRKEDPSAPSDALLALRASLDEREQRLDALTATLERKTEEEAAVRASYSVMQDQLAMCVRLN